MPDKYLELAAGIITEVEALDESEGAGDAGALVALDATGKLDNSLFPTGIGAETKLIKANGNLAAGDFVNIYFNAEILCRKADATNPGKEANGFVLEAVTGGDDATIYLTGINNELTGLSPGVLYYLSDTAGLATSTPISVAGKFSQCLGRALSTSEIAFQPGPAITLA